jgi:hypothetical protein
MHPVTAIHYLANEYYAPEIPYIIRRAAAGTVVEDFVDGDHELEIDEAELTGYASDLALRPLAGGVWILVDLACGGEPYGIIEPRTDLALC